MFDFIESIAAMWENAPILATAAMISLKASAILLATALAAHVLRRLSAAKRHLLWSAGIGAAVIIPFATLSIPSWRIPVHYAAIKTAPSVVSLTPVDSSLGAGFAVAAVPETNAPAAAALVPSGLAAALPREDALAPIVAPLTELTLGQVLFVVWLAGALLALWPWVAGVRCRSRLEASASDLLLAPWERSLRTLRAEGLVPARVRVLAAVDCSTPMTWGIVRPIVLVPARTEWQEHERRNALLHEFAHVRRADYLCKLAARILCTVYWFNPLGWLAARAERLAREQACDDAVLRAGSRPSSYAQQLLEVAHGRPQPFMAVAALTMARRSNLSHRLRAILEARQDRSPTGRGFSSIALGAACALVPPLAALSPDWVRVMPVPTEAPAPPAVALASFPTAPRTAVTQLPPAVIVAQQAQDCAATSGKRTSTNIQSHDDGSRDQRRWQVKWNNGVCRIDLDIRGAFTLSPNADDIVALSSGGYFDLEEDDGRVERRLRMVRGAGGGIERTFWVDGQRKEWDAEAAAWLARTFIMLDRRTAFAVDVRLPMLLQRGGVEAVMTEVAHMTTTYPQRVYFTKLFQRQTLTTEQLVRVLETATRNFDSGYEKAELLLQVAKQSAFAEPVYLAYAQMGRSIDSDYEKRRAFAALLARSDLKPEVVRAMLQATEGMQSDYELAELLIGIDRRYAVDETTRPFYVRAVSTIQSDYEQRRVLTTIMRAGDLGPATTGEIIAIAGRSMKGYELAEFLVTISAKGSLDQATSAAFFNAAKNVESDYERRRVLEALLKKGELTRPVTEGILATAATIDSDYECAELLVALSRAVKIDDALRPAFEKAAATIGSDYEYGRAMSAVRRSAQRT